MHVITMIPIGNTTFDWFDSLGNPQEYEVPNWIVCIDGEACYNDDDEAGLVIPLPDGGNVMGLYDASVMGLTDTKDGLEPEWCAPQIIATLNAIGEPYTDLMRGYLAAFVGRFNDVEGHIPHCVPELVFWDTSVAYLSFQEADDGMIGVQTYTEKGDPKKFAELLFVE